jgi:hypothetical protein
MIFSFVHSKIECAKIIYWIKVELQLSMIGDLSMKKPAAFEGCSVGIIP